MNRSALLALALLPISVFAQEQNPRVLQDKEAVTFNEVERGFYFRATGGAWFLINPPADNTSARPFSSGQMAQVEVGYDIGERISLGAFIMATTNRATSDYTGRSGGVVAGDFSSVTPGLAARVSLVGFDDNQEVRRTWIYIRAGAGYSLLYPKVLFGQNPSDILLFAGPGVEYFTRLRHFSVGVEVVGSFLVNGAAVGFGITPHVRYAF